MGTLHCSTIIIMSLLNTVLDQDDRKLNSEELNHVFFNINIKMNFQMENKVTCCLGYA